MIRAKTNISTVRPTGQRRPELARPRLSKQRGTTVSLSGGLEKEARPALYMAGIVAILGLTSGLWLTPETTTSRTERRQAEKPDESRNKCKSVNPTSMRHLAYLIEEREVNTPRTSNKGLGDHGISLGDLIFEDKQGNLAASASRELGRNDFKVTSCSGKVLGRINLSDGQYHYYDEEGKRINVNLLSE